MLQLGAGDSSEVMCCDSSGAELSAVKLSAEQRFLGITGVFSHPHSGLQTNAVPREFLDS